MKFLLDMNVPRSLAPLLRGEGHDCRHAGDADLARATDAAMVEGAREAGETILTHDLDFGHLLAFSGQREPSVVIFRPQDSRAPALFSRLQAAWSDIEKPLEEGAIVVLEAGRVRIRPLPVKP